MIKVTTAAEGLQQDGIDPTTAWADDPGLTDVQRARLRAMGRSGSQRRYNERGRFLNNRGHGLGADGKQAIVATPTRPTEPTPAAQDFAPAAVSTPSQIPDDNALATIDDPSFENEAPVSIGGRSSIDPVAAALLSRNQAPAVQPGQTVVTTAPATGGALKDAIPLLGLVGMFLL